MNRVMFIRHGATAGNLQRRYIGRTDEPLCREGIAQLAGQTAPAAEFLFVSPMLRTRQTAQLLFPGREQILCSGLREMDFGCFEGKTADELTGDLRYQRWVDGGCTGPAPEGEAVADFKDRCCAAFLKAMARVRADSTAVFVIHGGCIMAILERFFCPERDFYGFYLPNGGQFSAQWQPEQQILTAISTD